MKDMKIRPLILSALLSCSLHGALGVLLIPSFFNVSPQVPATFEVAWLTSSPPCHPHESGNPEKSQQRKKRVTLKKTLSFLKKVQSPSTRSLDPRFRGDDTKDKKSSTDPKLSRFQNDARDRVIHSHHPLPSYPWVCRKRGQEGVVCLHVKTNKEGHVVEVNLYKSSGHDLLDKAALEAVKSWILSEGNSDKTLSIAFRLEGEAVSFS